MLGQTRQRLALAISRQRQIRAHEAARDGVQLVAPRLVGGRTAGFEQRGLQQRIQGDLGRVAAGGQQRRSVRRRSQQGQRRQQVARRRRQSSDRSGEHLAEHFTFGARQSL